MWRLTLCSAAVPDPRQVVMNLEGLEVEALTAVEKPCAWYARSLQAKAVSRLEAARWNGEASA